MDNSFHEQGSHTRQDSKRFLVSLPILGNLMKWLASLIQWTEDEEEQAVSILITGEANDDRSNAFRPAHITHKP